jgi:hypothetical protein
LLLTEPGSVFVLTVAANQLDNAQEHIRKWLKSGLPLPEWACEAHGNTWQENPFLPQHGYGEVAVNLHMATQLSPSSYHD